MKLILAITGASGSIYAKRIIDLLEKNKSVLKIKDIAVIFSQTGIKVWNHEINNYKINQIPFKIYDNNNYFTPFASGSSNYDIMIICPATMGTIGKIANTIADNLIVRTADVILKENKKLIVVPREMPYNLIHIENMRKIILAGAKICPASPSFYAKPKNYNQLIDTVVQKIFKLAKINIKFFEWMNKNFS